MSSQASAQVRALANDLNQAQSTINQAINTAVHEVAEGIAAQAQAGGSVAIVSYGADGHARISGHNVGGANQASGQMSGGILDAATGMILR